MNNNQKPEDSDNTKFDEFERELQKQLSILKKCQSQKGIDSCMKCEQLIDCQIREEYVKAVYMSMNKGVTGGFEF